MIALLAALAADAALGQTSYPTALDMATLDTWLRQATDLSPEQVIAVSPSAVTAIVSRSRPETPGPAQVLLRAEALTPQAAARTGLLSWVMRLDVDCKTGQIRTGETSGFATRRADGQAVAVAPAQGDWRKPASGTALDAAWRATCEAHFQPPLGGVLRVAVVQPAADPSATASDAAAAPPSPARPATAHPQPKTARVAIPARAPVLTRASTGEARNAVALSTSKAAPARAASARAASAKSAQPLAATAQSEAPKPPPGRGGDRAVQVVSSPVEADTRRSLDGLRGRLGDQLAGLETRVVSAQVKGHTVYRGMIAGFATRSDASAFCQSLRASGHDCLAR